MADIGLGSLVRDGKLQMMRGVAIERYAHIEQSLFHYSHRGSEPRTIKRELSFSGLPVLTPETKYWRRFVKESAQIRIRCLLVWRTS